MRFEKHPITALIPANYNPRKKLKPGDPEFEKIKTSIEEFGYTDPIIVNSDMTIIGGHQRWSVLKELGYDEVDCVVVDVDKTGEKALNIALNKITGAWDNEKLADLLRGLQTLDYDATKTGFDPPEMDEIFNSVHSKETREDDCAIPLPENPVTQSGDVWELGRHRLICGDGSAPGVIKTLMEGKKANITIADAPPIGSGNAADYYEMLQHAFTLAAENMAKDASIYVFHSDAEGLGIRRAFQNAGLYLSGVCVWIRQTGAAEDAAYRVKHEPVLFGWKKNGKHKWYSDRKQSTVWKFERQNKSSVHPGMKPIALCAYPMLNSTMTNGVVLDPFAGIGGTLIAAEQTLRVCRSAESDPARCDVTVQRFIKLAGSIRHKTADSAGMPPAPRFPRLLVRGAGYGKAHQRRNRMVGRSI